MRKKIILFILLCVAISIANAEVCPSLADIKHQLPKGWAFFDSDDGTPLSLARINQFKNTATQFALAEWLQDAHLGGIIHCYYRDQNGSDLEAYLAKAHYVPFNDKHLWYHVSGYMHCAASLGQCMFNADALKDKRHFVKTEMLRND